MKLQILSRTMFSIGALYFLTSCAPASLQGPVGSQEFDLSIHENVGLINGHKIDKPKSNIARSLVFLKTSQDGKNISGVCTGVALAPKVILTAAHCLQEVSKAFVVSAVSPSTAGIESVSQKIHPTFKAVGNGLDVGLIFLNRALPKNTGFAKMISSETKLEIGTPIASFGYGVNEIVHSSYFFGLWASKEEKFDQALRAGQFELTYETEADDKILGPHLLVIGSEKQALCNGDSGGPAFIADERNPLLVGLTSFGVGEDCKSGINVLTSLKASVSWIHKTMASFN